MKNGRYIQCLPWNFKAHTPIYLRGKYTNNRAKNMKFDSIFFTVATRNKRCTALSEPWLCSFTIANKFALYSLAQALRRRNIYVPKGVRLAAPESIFDIYIKYTNNRAKNMKLDSIFFTASAVYIRGLLNLDFQKSFSINGLVIYIYSMRRGLNVFIHIQIVHGFWEHLFFFGAIR